MSERDKTRLQRVHIRDADNAPDHDRITRFHQVDWRRNAEPGGNEDYMPQMIAQMACTDRCWVDFVSHCPRMPKRLRTFIRRYARDEKRTRP